MNTVRSVYYGWATLIVAGGGAYYFAKRSINADRAAKVDAEHKRRLAQYQLEQQYTPRSTPQSTPQNTTGPITAELSKRTATADTAPLHSATSNPSQEASADPAATRHAPEDEAQRALEKSKYEASEVFRSRKGDRFS
ncbi:hypothetical protein BDV95DRAFT_573281 [Massariosphaeria phaeospora]|uniref:Uncharacterized protein n=1 Tax=Massariosphaeria phaeospora TaxID=100035 RepID=A0A7C8I559_9PLEO|nr:hypothetical protein BDV95DRAFT_573281 [Massariosphaeria phaeospora]